MESSDSGGSFELETAEPNCETEMKFEQGGVSQKFTYNDTRKREVLIPGKLFLSESKFGEFVEWKPDEGRSPSPFDTESKSDTSRDGREWALVHGAGNSKIGFKAGKDSAVEFVPDPRTTEYKRPVRLELAEIRSILIPSRAKGKELIFILQDGTSHNPFIFERGSIDNFTDAMERYVCVSKAKDNKDLRLVTPKKPRVNLPQPTIAELFLPEQVNNLIGLIKDVRNDPMAVAKTGLAKLADYTATQLNGYAEQQRQANKDSHSPSSTPRDANAFSPNKVPSTGIVLVNQPMSDGLDPDYATNEEGYEVIFKPQKLNIDLGSRRKAFRGQPLSQEQWLNYLDNEGRITNFEEIKQIVFRGGCDSAIRKHVWIFLLDLYDSNSTFEQRKEIYFQKMVSYEVMKTQWSTITEDQEERFHAFRDFKSLVEKDVARTDRCLEFFSGDNNHWIEVLRRILMTYMMYNFNLGYVQGMSDILSPILMEVQDEVLAFWLFVKFMDSIYKNFEMSQETMQQQLKDSYSLLQLIDPRFSAYLNACDAANMYFAFRWLLILFKREFSTTDVLLLWEALWTKIPGPNFHLFCGIAILEQHKATIMDNKFGLSEILRHVNDLSMKIDLCETLTLAESLYVQLFEAQANLPNNVRLIFGLPEKVESRRGSDGDVADTAGPSTSRNDPIIIIDGNSVGDTTLQLSDSILRSPSPVTPSPTAEEQSLELNCDLGISQFL